MSGLSRACATPFGFLLSSDVASSLLDNAKCKLTALPQTFYQYSLVIPIRRDSPYLGLINHKSTSFSGHVVERNILVFELDCRRWRDRGPIPFGCGAVILYFLETGEATLECDQVPFFASLSPSPAHPYVFVYTLNVLRDGGLTSRLRKLSWPVRKKAKLEEQWFSVDLQDVRPVLTILGIGSALAGMIFLLEVRRSRNTSRRGSKPSYVNTRR
ncbi:unnamed protein product [Timema podura]|uniref:Uncharacterized protein n=1 Tax=Timema podura TaxID=61482 RepID=A0ABN7P1A8_TIMPD|nr:unnamed protein product [Timema podura]